MRPPYRPTWRMNLSRFLAEVVPRYRPRVTVVMINIGFWLGKDLVRKGKAAQYVRAHPDEVCPAKWEEGEKTLAPSLQLVGKI